MIFWVGHFLTFYTSTHTKWALSDGWAGGQRQLRELTVYAGTYCNGL